jgi:hypothetical protein
VFCIYGNAKVNVKGRVNLGFGWIEKKDLQSNKLTRTEYSQTYPYTGHITATNQLKACNLEWFEYRSRW